MSAKIDRVIVTGASSGIGFDVARLFLEAGSRVVINARDPEKLEQARRALGHEDRVAAVAGSVGEVATVRRIVQAAQARFDGVDVLVNNAGIFGAKPFVESTEAELDAFYTTNVKGTFLLSQAAVPHLIAAGGGAIINVGTVLVEQPIGLIPCAAAMASKGGVHALTRALAIELAPHAIRVNAVAPGFIRTPLLGDGADAMGKLHPLRRLGEANEVAEAVLYLARSAFVTGTVLDVDGGYAHGR
jgi:NAD(P)-dependent dehydrogenase (short-subunit alcohol dehydrogenase family)